MKKTTALIISILTGVFPSWIAGYKLASLIESLTSSTKMIGNRRMFFHLHPALKLVLAACIAALLLYIWYKVTSPIFIKLSNLRLKANLSAPDGSLVRSFFSFGQWTSETIVQTIFYAGLIGILVPVVNIAKTMFYDFSHYYQSVIPTQTAFLAVLSALVGVILWKCTCEILLILIRAVQAYFYKTVNPDHLKNLDPLRNRTDNSNFDADTDTKSEPSTDSI